MIHRRQAGVVKLRHLDAQDLISEEDKRVSPTISHVTLALCQLWNVPLICQGPSELWPNGPITHFGV